MFQGISDLIKRNTGKPFDELRRLRAILQILEQRGEGHTGTTKDPHAADPLRIAIHRRTRRPINHFIILTPWGKASTARAPVYLADEDTDFDICAFVSLACFKASAASGGM